MISRLAAGATLLWLAALTSVEAEESIAVRGGVTSDILGVESPEAFATRIRNLVGPADFAIVAACAEPRIFVLKTVGSFEPNDQISRKVSETGKPVWLVEVRASGCSAERLHNIYVFPRAASPAVLVQGIPGQTQAGLELQATAEDALADLAATLVDGCRSDPLVIDTRVLQNSETGKPWVEEWSLRACNKPTRVRATFTPSPSGVALNIETKW